MMMNETKSKGLGAYASFYITEYLFFASALLIMTVSQVKYYKTSVRENRCWILLQSIPTFIGMAVCFNDDLRDSASSYYVHRFLHAFNVVVSFVMSFTFGHDPQARSWDAKCTF